MQPATTAKMTMRRSLNMLEGIRGPRLMMIRRAGKIQCGIFGLGSIVQCQTRQFDGVMAFDMAQSGSIPLTQNERIITHLGATS